MSQSTTTTTTTRGASKKRVREEPEQTPDVLDMEIIKEILKEVRNSKVLLR
jgi:ribosomal protein S25